MIISHTYKYLFVELPRTGSTAISRELCQQYDGQRILRKHSTYYDFLREATAAEREYFVFSGIRNPLDDAVSRYFKLSTNHNQRFTDPRKTQRRSNLAERLESWLFGYVTRHDADFETFFRKSYVFPYNNWATMSRQHYDYVIRFEHLQEDFECALRLIGIEPKRPLPLRNPTAKRRRNFAAYYSEKSIPRAKRIFGPFMRAWGYEFPAEWGQHQLPWWNELAFDFANLFRVLYWRHLRFRFF
jgi:hypothetical protein